MRQKCNRRVRTQLQQATRPVGRCWAERSCGWICRLVVFFPSLAPSSPAANATERLYHSSGRPETESGKKNNRASPGTHFTPQEKITPQRRTFQFFLCLVSKSARLYHIKYRQTAQSSQQSTEPHHEAYSIRLPPLLRLQQIL